MSTLKKIGYVAALGLLAAATTSFAEVGYVGNPYDYHGGPVGTTLPYQRPTVPSYGGNYGTVSGTIANGGGFSSGYNQFQSPVSSFNQFNQGMLFNPYFAPYLNSAPWQLYGSNLQYPYGNNYMWSNPWTNWNVGYGNMVSPYFGSQWYTNPYQSQSYGNQFYNPYQYNQFSQFQSPYQSTGLPWQYNSGIPGLGYNLGGLGTSNFWDYGLSSSPYNNYWGNGYGNYNYDNYGLGLGFGNQWYTDPYSSGVYGGLGFNGSGNGWGFNGGLWWN